MKQQGASGTIGNPGRRFAAARSAGGATGLALLMLLAAAGQGAAGPVVVVTKPYKGFVTGENDAYHLGCGKAASSTAATFSKTTGIAAFAGTTTAPKCSFTLGAGGYSYFQVQVSIPIGLSAGNHRVSVNWSLAAAGSEVLTPGKCVMSTTASYSSCVQEGRAYVQAYVYVEDANATQYYPSTYWPGFFTNGTYNATWCSSGSCISSVHGASGKSQSFSSSTTFVWAIHLTKLPAGHHFYVVTAIYGGAYCEAQTSNSAISG